LNLRRYSLEHRQFLTGTLPPLLSRVANRGTIADLGCGDGAVLAALARQNLVEGAIAVDISPERVAAAVRAVPEATGVVASASATDIPAESVDGVVCSQVIEHMPDHDRVAGEIARILRPGGWWYVGTVLRRPRAWWIYRIDGVWRLDPTHVREYESVDEVRAVLTHPQLRVEQVNVSAFRFPVTDLALRALARVGIVSHDQIARAYPERPRLKRLRGLAISPPGFRMIELAGVKTQL
jgi:2-polyprenyl-3-methyl-5-hydroxy-6-metoxy-1,4-benzoquinol methylase